MDTEIAGPRVPPARGLATVLGVATVVVLPLCFVPGTRPGAVIAISALATLAPVLGLVRHRPADRLPWLAVITMLAGWALSITVGEDHPDIASTAQEIGTVAGVGVVLFMFAQNLGSRRGAAARGVADRARHVDTAMLAVVIGLAAAQIVTTARAEGAPASALWAPLDILLISVVLRFVFSRAALGPGIKLFVAGTVLAGTYDCITANSGVRLAPLSEPVTMIWATSMALFVAGALHPRMAEAFTRSSLQHLRPESGRVLGLVALAPVPLALALLHPAGRLPWLVYVGAGTLVAALTIVRGAQALSASEGHARRDPLTGLANRRGLQTAFDALLLGARTAGGPVGRLALLDLDDFKNVNDTYGHETGDLLLTAVATRLEEAVGTRGTVARSGGDEFVLVLLPEAPPVADLVATAFGTPVQLAAGRLRHAFDVRCSTGWVELTGACELSLALADADIALYVSKGSRRGTATRFAPEQREEVLGQLGLGEDLRRLVAGEPGAGELVLVFQPLVALVDGTVLGCEALLRWQHPTRGLLSPDTFLPIAEARGQGAALDAWVLEEACRSAAQWPADDWSVSVNLGRSSMVDPALACRVQRALAAGGLDPRRLHLEITEHDQLPTDAGVATLRTLADTGVGISLDDFGTGYTSLAYLQRYPIGVLKLDRSITGADAANGLLTGIVAMAEALGISVLAEGVETDEQCRRLAGFGIDRGQGWLFGRPVPADQLVAAAHRRAGADHLVGG